MLGVAAYPTLAEVPFRVDLVVVAVPGQQAVATVEDAGAAGVIVSNHGGRVLDSQLPAVKMLPAIRQALGPDALLLVDGGIRRGTDVLKAIALGADAVLIGRPYIHALTTAGALGVAHLLKLLREELEVAMALCGCRELADITVELLLPAHAR